MSIEANNPNLKSWVNTPENTDFPIQNLPFGVFKTSTLSKRVGVRIGDYVIDLKSLHVLGYLDNLPFKIEDFDTEYLNKLMKVNIVIRIFLIFMITSKVFATNNNLFNTTITAKDFIALKYELYFSNDFI